jgi:hypothetical protein
LTVVGCTVADLATASDLTVADLATASDLTVAAASNLTIARLPVGDLTISRKKRFPGVYNTARNISYDIAC